MNTVLSVLATVLATVAFLAAVFLVLGIAAGIGNLLSSLRKYYDAKAEESRYYLETLKKAQENGVALLKAIQEQAKSSSGGGMPIN